MNALKVVIFGAGSIGLYCGGLLVNGGVDVTFIGRERFKQTLAKDGFKLTHYANPILHIPSNKFSFETSPNKAAAQLKAADVVIMCVKTQDTAQAARDLSDYIRDDTLVMSFQNGLRNTALLSGEIVNCDRILGAVVPFNVTPTDEMTWHCGTEGYLSIQSKDDPRMSALKAAFAVSGQSVEFFDDIIPVQWGKLLVNLNNGLNTLSGVPLKQALGDKAYRLCLAAMIEEALVILSHAKITPAAFGKTSPQKTIKILRLPNWLYGIIMNSVIKIDAAARSSMLDDLEAGRPCEIDYLQGEVIAMAKRQGLEAPINEAVMALVLEAFNQGVSPKMSAVEMRQKIMG